MNRIYLDQASTSFPKAPGVAQAMMDYLTMNGVNVNRGCYSSAYSAEEVRHASCWQNFSTFPNAKM